MADKDDWRESSPMANRNTSEEYLKLAEVGLDAYRNTLPENQRHNALVPFALYATVGRAIELALKSFLMHVGIPLQDLRNPRKFGHNLESCLHTAVEHGLLEYAMLTSLDQEVIQKFSEPYRQKRFDYARVGEMTLPAHIDQLMPAANRLMDGVQKTPFEPVAPPDVDP